MRWDKYMFNNMTVSRLDNVSHRVRSKGKKTVQCTHCALQWLKVERNFVLQLLGGALCWFGVDAGTRDGEEITTNDKGEARSQFRDHSQGVILAQDLQGVLRLHHHQALHVLVRWAGGSGVVVGGVLLPGDQLLGFLITLINLTLESAAVIWYLWSSWTIKPANRLKVLGILVAGLISIRTLLAVLMNT